MAKENTERSIREFVTEATNKQFFTVTDNLYMNESGVPNGYSRFSLAIILFKEHRGTKRAPRVTANLKAGFMCGERHDDFLTLTRAYEEFKKKQEREAIVKAITATAGGETGYAFLDVKIYNGQAEVKGKTIREILLAGNKNALLEHGRWLKSNLGTYPQNREIMDAIKKGIKLYEADKSKVTAAKTADGFEEFFSTPLKSQKGRSNIPGLEEKTRFYQLSIGYNPKMGKPFIFKITNKWGDVVKDGEMIHIDNKHVAYEQTENFCCTQQKFEEILAYMKVCWQSFMEDRFHLAREKGIAADAVRREEYKKTAGTSVADIAAMEGGDSDNDGFDDFGEADSFDDFDAIDETTAASTTSAVSTGNTDSDDDFDF